MKSVAPIVMLTVLLAGFALAQAPLVGTTWQLRAIQGMDESLLVVETPERYTLSLSEDGRASVRLDCNRGTASYTLDGAGLRFGPIASTRALCPSDSHERRYLRELEAVASFVLEDGTLYLATRADGAILEFVQAPAEK